MAKLGSPQTARINFGRMELQIGTLSQAGLLTQSQSIGILDKVDLNFDRQVATRKAGTPQATVATETISNDLMITATCGETSKRNMRLVTNTGIANYDDLPTVANLVNTDTAILAGATSFYMADDALLTAEITRAADAASGAAGAENVFANNTNGVTLIASITPQQATNVLSSANRLINPSGVDQAAYILGATEGKIVANRAALGITTGTTVFYNDDEISKVLTAANVFALATSATNKSVATSYYSGLTDLLAHGAYTGASADSATAVKAAVTTAAAALTVVAGRERHEFTFSASDSTVDAGKQIKIGGLTFTRNATAATAAQLATAWTGLTAGVKAADIATSPYGTWSGTLSSDYNSVAGGTAVKVKFQAVADKTNVADISFAIPTATVNKLTDSTVLTTITKVTVQGVSTAEATAYNKSQNDLITFVLSIVASTQTASGTKAKSMISGAILATNFIVEDTSTSSAGTVHPYKSAYLAGLSDVANLGAKIAASGGTDYFADNIISNVVNQLSLVTEGYIYGFDYVTKAVQATNAAGGATLVTLEAAVNLAASNLNAVATSAGVEPGTYVMFYKDDPAYLNVVDVVGFNPSTLQVTLSALTPITSGFSSGVDTRLYKGVVYGGGQDQATTYYSLRLIQLDAKGKLPKVIDVWKASINQGQTLSLNNTDFVNFDLAFTTVYPTVTDYQAGGELFHMKNQIIANPLYRVIDVGDK